MKKLFVLLLAAAVAAGASAGINTKLINPNTTKDTGKKTTGVIQNNLMKRGDVTAIQGSELSVFDRNARPAANHALKAGNTLVWDFEDEAQIEDWTMLDQDGDGFGWELILDGSMKAHSGIGAMSSASYDNPTHAPLFPDNWLISPEVTLTGKLGFYYCGQDAAYASEVFAVYIWLFDEAEPVKISEDIVASGRMKAFEFDLSDYEGMYGNVCIRHYNVTDMFRLNIDDVTIGEFEADPEPVNPMLTEIPEGCTMMTFLRNSYAIYPGFFGLSEGKTEGLMQLAFDEANGEVYMYEPMWYWTGYGAWIKGIYTLEDGVYMLSFPVGQYIAWSDDAGYGIQLYWGNTYVYYDDVEGSYQLGYEIDERATEIQFMIENGRIYMLDSEGDANAEFPDNYNVTGMMAVSSNSMTFDDIEFVNVGEAMGGTIVEGPTTPANPTCDNWYDEGDDSGFNYLEFTLPTTDVNGEFLNPEYLSYSIFVDNGNGPELFTFPAIDYTYDLYDDITEVPYELYSNAVDFHASYCYFYRTNAEGYEPLFTENIGIQVYYTVDGVKNASDIAWLYPHHVNVDEVNAAKTVASVRYFNVAGQEIAQPEGMTIRVTTYTDGTTSIAKVVK